VFPDLRVDGHKAFSRFPIRAVEVPKVSVVIDTAGSSTTATAAGSGTTSAAAGASATSTRTTGAAATGTAPAGRLTRVLIRRDRQAGQ